jgi:hypothetical protein
MAANCLIPQGFLSVAEEMLRENGRSREFCAQALVWGGKRVVAIFEAALARPVGAAIAAIGVSRWLSSIRHRAAAAAFEARAAAFEAAAAVFEAVMAKPVGAAKAAIGVS